LIKQGAKLVTCAEDVTEALPTPVRAALTKLEQPEAEQLAGGAVVDRQRTEDLCEPRPIDDIVETTGLNSSDVLATLSIWK